MDRSGRKCIASLNDYTAKGWFIIIIYDENADVMLE